MTKILCKLLTVTVVIASLIPWASGLSLPEASASGHLSVLVPVNLRVESLDDPVGVDSARPRFSWTFESADTNARALSQTAYQVLVASSPELLSKDQGDAWDSGRISSTSYIQIEFAGKPLLSHTKYFWKVRTWDQKGTESNWSKSATWTAALLSRSDWKAKWIAAEVDGPSQTPAIEHVNSLENPGKPLPIFRRDFEIKGTIRSAVVAVSGLGQYELRLNGKDVSDAVLTPGWTNYRKTVLYNVYDVSRGLHRGRNTFGVLLGNGMYNVPNDKDRYTKFTGFFGQPKFILQLHVTYSDGTTTTLLSDSSWKCTSGPITFSSTYGGEDYDARKDPHGWDSSGFDDSKWIPALEVNGPGGSLSGHIVPPIRVAKTFQPVSIAEPKPGILVYDLGQNIAGWPRITVRGRAGQTARLIAGELLNPDGTVSQHSANADPTSGNLFSYTLKGSGDEEWHPRFSYWGFRYVQVEGATRSPSNSAKPLLVSLEGQFLHDDVAVDGSFVTSKPLFNQIHHLINAAILSNMMSVLTDCPHREKLGWLEQTHLAGASIMFNYDVLHLYQKISNDMGDAQLANGLVPAIAPEYVAFVDRNGVSTSFRDSPEWGSAAIISPWIAYQFYGDKRLLADHYDEMRRYADYLTTRAQDHMLAYGLGDWYDIGPKPPGESQLTGKGLTATAIYYQDLTILAQISTVLGKASEARDYAEQAKEVKSSFNLHLFHSETNQYDRGSQTALAMPLALGLVPEGHRPAVLDNLVEEIRKNNNHVTAGDIGFHYVVRALSDGGRSDVLNDMLSRTDSPSYGYQLSRGATTLTEAWDTNPDSSQNHFMLGHGEEWFYRGLAGIEFDLSRDEAERIVFRPAPVGDIESASATYNSVLGSISSSWHISGSSFTFDVRVPPGASATVFIPTVHGSSLMESGRAPNASPGIRTCVAKDLSTSCVVGSGDYHFQASR
jgi:alpha-L-rhamnosidase